MWRPSTESLQALLQEMGEAVMVLDAGGQVLYASPVCRRLLGKAMGRAGILRTGALHPDDADVFDDMRRLLLAHPNRRYLGHARTLARDGSWRQLQVTAVNRLHSPPLGGLVAVWRDVTEHKRMEAAARLADRRWHQLAADPIVILDLRGRVLLWNKGSERLLGWSEREMLGKVLPWIPPGERAAAAERIRRVVEDHIDITVEVERFSKSGKQVPLLVTLSPAVDKDGVAGVIAISKT